MGNFETGLLDKHHGPFIGIDNLLERTMSQCIKDGIYKRW